MDKIDIFKKFGGEYSATPHTYILGIDTRITSEISKRFTGHVILETCTGAGFTTISLAKVSQHVITVEIDSDHQSQARANIRRAGLSSKVTFVLGDALSDKTHTAVEGITAAFLDPDWAVTGPDHVYKFQNSNTLPPADKLLEKILDLTPNVALIQAPYIDVSEFKDLPDHELQAIYLDNEHVLYCLYFGDLIATVGQSELRV